MTGKRCLILFALLPVCLLTGHVQTNAGKASRFDRLTEPDRVAFSKRFEQEIWPMLTRNGKDGCVGCHSPKHRTALRFSGKPDADFRKLLSDGFLLVNDPGGMLHVVSTTNSQQRMPPGDRTPWTKAEIKVLRQFVSDVAKKQQK